jgi:hypothetical protein
MVMIFMVMAVAIVAAVAVMVMRERTAERGKNECAGCKHDAEQKRLRR